MQLLDYVNGKRGEQTRLAEILGIDSVLIHQWAHGKRDVPIERCVPLEAATQGEVMRWDLRPDDWHEIWPELIKRKGAPALPRS